MDAHLIYTVATRLFYYVTWKETDNHGWAYCGLSNDLKRDLLKEHINDNFQNKKIYIVLTRKDSRELDISDAIEAIASNIDATDFSLWSQDFKHVMAFNKIGTFREGICTADTSFIK